MICNDIDFNNNYDKIMVDTKYYGFITASKRNTNERFWIKIILVYHQQSWKEQVYSDL